MKITKKWNKMFQMGMAAMALAFITTLALVGCGPKSEDATSITISGTAKVGETLTAVITNPLNPNGIASTSDVKWHYYSDAACTNRVGGSDYPNRGTPSVIPTSAAEKWIRASTYGFTGDGQDCDDIYSNILGPVPVPAPGESVTISPTTATVAKSETKSFTVTINEAVTNSANVVWTVVGSTPSGTSTITGSVHGISGSTTTQNGILTVGASETATTLTVKVTYGTKSATATVTITP
ncbi:hypothetical protein FACS189462_1840 [Spirochaetia bacterium]|nr:hypothetical protein FACS189462_1840 [Spirochaetia bacterium]